MPLWLLYSTAVSTCLPLLPLSYLSIFPCLNPFFPSSPSLSLIRSLPPLTPYSLSLRLSRSFPSYPSYFTFFLLESKNLTSPLSLSLFAINLLTSCIESLPYTPYALSRPPLSSSSLTLLSHPPLTTAVLFNFLLPFLRLNSHYYFYPLYSLSGTKSLVNK